MPGEFDFESAADEIGSGLGLDLEKSDTGDDLDRIFDGNDGGDTGGDVVTPPTGVVDTPAPGADGKPAPAAGAPASDPPPPDTWRDTAKPFWAALPAEVKAEIAKREADAMEGINQYKADAAQGRSFAQAIAPFKDVMQQYGIDAVKQIDGLMRAHYTLALGKPEEKIALINKLITDYQIELPAGSGAGGETPFVDPQVQGLLSKISALESQLNGFTAQSQRAETARVEAEITSFLEDPKNTYAKELVADMASYIQKGMCSTLAEAYQRAMWTNPTVRAKELTRQQTESAAAAEKEAAERAAAAKAATAANVRSRAKDGRSAVPLGSLDDTLKETLAKIHARG